ncbi:MAG: hypothetical protein AAGG48_07675 [Planctomycetota bacterium]
MLVASCPLCLESFRVPSGPIPADAIAVCPWCQEQVPLQDVMNGLPPVLEFKTSDGSPISIDDAPAATANQLGHAQESPAWESDSASPIDEPYRSDEEDSSPADDWNLAGTGLTSTANDGSMSFGDDQMRVMPVPVRRRKKGSGIRTAIGVVLGGFAAVPIAGGLLMLMGRTPDWGVWPFDGGSQESGPGVIAAPTGRIGERPYERRPFGQSLLEPDSSTTDPRESALDSILSPEPSPGTSTPETPDADSSSNQTYPGDRAPERTSDVDIASLLAPPGQSPRTNRTSGSSTPSSEPVESKPSLGAPDLDSTGFDSTDPDPAGLGTAIDSLPIDVGPSELVVPGLESSPDLENTSGLDADLDSALASNATPSDSAIASSIGDRVDLDSQLDPAPVKPMETPSVPATNPSLDVQPTDDALELPAETVTPAEFVLPTSGAPTEPTKRVEMELPTTPLPTENPAIATTTDSPITKPIESLEPSTPEMESSDLGNAKDVAGEVTVPVGSGESITLPETALPESTSSVPATVESPPDIETNPALESTPAMESPTIVEAPSPTEPVESESTEIAVTGTETQPRTLPASNTDVPSNPTRTTPTSLQPERATLVQNVKDAEKLLGRLTRFTGPTKDRRFLLRDTYLKAVEACSEASKDSPSIQALAKKIAGSSVIKEIEAAGLDWISFGKRKFDGVVIVGQADQIDDQFTLSLSNGNRRVLKGVYKMPSQTQVVALGRIIDDETIEVIASEPLK